ncbi:ribonuclease H [Streptomyces sp. NPDC093707]|uniref:ribonuclease H family protein n=1 Tax=Streptomyces sp. NPDC093707 TaxID=3154984 RepID=UPI00344DEE01
MSDRIIAACDGASKGNPGRAAWAWVTADADQNPTRWEAGPLGTATNNVAELTALAELLEATDPALSLEVRMDSQYAMNAVTKWIAGWKRNGWMTASKKPVANRELVVRIDALLAGREVEFRYVPAHQVDGDPLNAIADQAASDVAVSQQAAGTSHGAQTVPAPRAEAMVRPAGGSGKPATSPRRTRTGGGGGGGTIKAKYAGRCGGCRGSYEAGTQVAKGPNGWGHPDCR